MKNRSVLPLFSFFVLGSIGLFSNAFALESNETFFLPDIGDEIVITWFGIAECETEKNIFCGADSTQSQFRLEVTNISKDSISGIAKGSWSHTNDGFVFYNGHSYYGTSLKSDLLVWELRSALGEANSDVLALQMSGTMNDGSGNKFKFETSGFIIPVTPKISEQEMTLKSFDFFETTITRSDGRTLTEFSKGKSSFMDYSDDGSLSITSDKQLKTMVETITSNPVKDPNFDSSLDVSDVEGYPDIATNAKGIAKCETIKLEFCGGFETRTQLNLEVTEVSDKTLSGTGEGKIVVEHTGDILELRSNSIYWMTDGLPHEASQIVIGGTLYDDFDNAYEFETIGLLVFDDSDGEETVQVRTSASIYFEYMIKDPNDHIFTSKEIGRINSLLWNDASGVAFG